MNANEEFAMETLQAMQELSVDIAAHHLLICALCATIFESAPELREKVQSRLGEYVDHPDSNGFCVEAVRRAQAVVGEPQ
ncbi:hypothetical protein [Allopusillimonas ginsengisoli]|uniref:hypothetical protein n=1 Tax=Allopusillimonas ginsengisoli TaxID=453575 RepID=UPI00101EC89C|nr:hypothetical protein [Allopusillimonas ginsengisoli]TEA79465.1 hypothetical protein ERE07_00440 [Allopusillimonas ginsengisoli]